jgi:hypothetical protein
MFNSQMVTTVLDWERRLEIEEQNRNQHRYEDVFGSETRFVAEEENTIVKFFNNLFSEKKPVQTPYNCCGYETQHKPYLG